MSFQSSFGWNHDFPRLVRQLGFKFITNKPKIQIDWNLIGCVNIKEVIANTEVYILEKHINDIIYYSLQEEEIQILDPKFVKLFRIAQLTLEYILFCLHYLDKGFVQLQKKLSEQEKKYEKISEELENKEKLLQKYKKKNADVQNTCHYHAHANLINGEIFQCEICKKMFISEDFLNLHKAKRQHYVSNKSVDESLIVKNQTNFENEQKLLEKQDNETDKLFFEIKQLKERINTTEQMLKNEKTQNLTKFATHIDTNIQTSLDSYAKNLSDNFVQCDLLTEKPNNENNIETIRQEIKEWREKESNYILNQLESIKDKFDNDFKKLMQIQEKSNVNPSRSDENLTSLEEKLDHKLESNVERLKSDLTAQEQKWRAKLAKLEMKSNLVTELYAKKSPKLIRQQSLSLTPSSPITIKHESDPSSSSIDENQKNRKSSLPVTNEIILVRHSGDGISETPHEDTPQKNILKNKENNFVEEIKQNKNVTFENSSPVQIIFTNSAESSNDTNIVSEVEPLNNEKDENIHSQTSKTALDKNSITSLKNVVLHNPKFLLEFRKTITDVMDSSLKELGVDPQWTSIPQETLENHFRTMQHTQKYVAKVYPNYYEIRSNILDQIEKIVSKELSKEPPIKHIKKSKKHISRKEQTSKNIIHFPQKMLENSMSTPTLIISPKHIVSESFDSNDVKFESYSMPVTRSLDRKIQQKVPNRELEPISNSPINRLRRFKSSQTIFSSVLKIKEKVWAAMKPSGTSRSNKLETNEENEPVSEGNEEIYNITPSTKNNSGMSSKILSSSSITQKDTIGDSPLHLSNISSSSISSEENINPQILSKALSSSEPSLSPNLNEQLQVRKPVETVNIIKKDPFIVQFSKPEPEHITQESSEKKSMYGDLDQDNTDTTEEHSIEEDGITSKKRTTVPSIPSVLKESNTLIKKTNPFTHVKKRVIFNLSKLSSKNSESKNPPTKEKSDSIDSTEESKRDNLPEKTIKSFSVINEKLNDSNKNRLHQSSFQSMYVDDDSTSISSSVLDGSIKNMILHDDNKESKDKMLKKKSDDLDISDFDFSSN